MKSNIVELQSLTLSAFENYTTDLRLSPCIHWVLPLSTCNTNMAKALSKSQIVTSLAETVGLTKKQAVQTIEALVALAYKNAKNSFTIPGLGKIVLVNRKARMGRNPATGETIKIAAKRVVKFRVAKAAKDAILGSK
jgi:DNA-binding protein HU-beta